MGHTGPVDFTSASYLGLRHRCPELRPWIALTTGRPATLGLSPPAREAAAGLARLLGAEQAILAPSTLHAMWDVVTAFPKDGYDIMIDAGAYETTRAGIAAGSRRAAVVAHYDVGAVARQCREVSERGRRPLLLLDATCPACGRVAPVADVVEVVGRSGGLVVIDDTQAIGLLGTGCRTPLGWGHGGGGTCRHVGLPPQQGSRLLVVASLGKGFSSPLAVIAGDGELVDRVARYGPSRTHSSPPSSAAVAAAVYVVEHPLRIGSRRTRVERLVEELRRRLARAGIAMGPSRLPLQLLPVDRTRAPTVQRMLHRHGIRVAIVRHRCSGGPALGICVRADHRHGQLGDLVEALTHHGGTRGRRSCSS